MEGKHAETTLVASVTDRKHTLLLLARSALTPGRLFCCQRFCILLLGPFVDVALRVVGKGCV